MGQVTMYSVGGIGGDPMYLALIGKCIRIGGPNGGDFATGDLPGGRRSIATQEEKDRFKRDYEAICETMSAQPHSYKIHSSFNHVPRRVIVSTTEQELADRARPKVREFVQGLTRSEGHLGDVLVLGAYPVLTADERGSELPPKDDPRYQTRPFAEALERYPHERFHVPYDVLLDLDGFTAWVLNSREDMGGHATRLKMIKESCGASV